MHPRPRVETMSGGGAGFAGEMHPRPRVETMSGGGAGFAGEMHPRKPSTQAVVAEEDDYGIDMPRKLSGGGSGM